MNMEEKKLDKFLKQYYACTDVYEFAKDLTLEQFLNTCERGDWILWLFARMNPENLRELTLAKGHCANTVRHLMRDEKSVKSVDAAIAFGENRITRQELADAADAAAYAAYADFADFADFAAAADAAAAAARNKNRKLTADICRKYLPLEIWDKSKL